MGDELSLLFGDDCDDGIGRCLFCGGLLVEDGPTLSSRACLCPLILEGLMLPWCWCWWCVSPFFFLAPLPLDWPILKLTDLPLPEEAFLVLLSAVRFGVGGVAMVHKKVVVVEGWLLSRLSSCVVEVCGHDRAVVFMDPLLQDPICFGGEHIHIQVSPFNYLVVLDGVKINKLGATNYLHLYTLGPLETLPWTMTMTSTTS